MANWPDKRVSAWSSLLKARAIENMSYTVGVNRVGTDGNDIPYSGHSEAFDPLGDSISSLEAFHEGINSFEINYAHLQRIREKLPFAKDADIFSIQ